MRIIGTVVLVLIAGTLKCTNTQSHEYATNSSCPGNARPLENFQNCYSPILREIRESLRDVGGIDAAIATYCSRTETLDNCLKSLRESSKFCLEPDSYVSTEEMINFAVSALQFPCANPRLIKDIWNSTDQQCPMSKLQTGLAYCGRSIVTDASTTFSGPQLPDDGFFRNHTCSIKLTSQECAVKLLEECEDKRFSRALDSLFKYINNDSPCENLPKSPKSQAPPDSTAANIS